MLFQQRKNTTHRYFDIIIHVNLVQKIKANTFGIGV